MTRGYKQETPVTDTIVELMADADDVEGALDELVNYLQKGLHLDDANEQVRECGLYVT